MRPQRAANTIGRRRISDLPVVHGPAQPGPELLLDTCVYIDVLQGRSPPDLDDLLEVRIVNHSTICLAELTHLFGRLHPGTKAALREVRRTIEEMPGHRLSSPSTTALGEAGMLAGLTARVWGASRSELPTLLNDASLYLQALENGWFVVTRNVRDFDLFDQLLPTGRVLFYEQG